MEQCPCCGAVVTDPAEADAVAPEPVYVPESFFDDLARTSSRDAAPFDIEFVD